MTTKVSNPATAPAKDPVCGMTVDPAKAKFRDDYKARRITSVVQDAWKNSGSS